MIDIFTNLREANIARQKLWTAGLAVPLEFRGVELAGEVGEACNIIKKIVRQRKGWKGSQATLMELAEELADVVICTDLIAMDCGINLNEAIAHKFNETSAKHGFPIGLEPQLIAESAKKPESPWLPIEKIEDYQDRYINIVRREFGLGYYDYGMVFFEKRQKLWKYSDGSHVGNIRHFTHFIPLPAKEGE